MGHPVDGLLIHTTGQQTFDETRSRVTIQGLVILLITQHQQIGFARSVIGKISINDKQAGLPQLLCRNIVAPKKLAEEFTCGLPLRSNDGRARTLQQTKPQRNRRRT